MDPATTKLVEGPISDVLGIGAGILAWMNKSVSKFPSYTSAPIRKRFEAALANTVGFSIVNAIDKTFVDTGADLKPNIFGWANGTTAGGILLLIADAIGQHFPKYRQLDGLHDIVEKVGWGVTLGGIAGGVFDPAAGQTGAGVGAPSGFVSGVGTGVAGSVAVGGVPFTRGEGQTLTVVV